jgi:hypothetical protein
MLVSSYVNGFGFGGQSFGAPSMLQLIEIAQERARVRAGFTRDNGFGAAISNFEVFQTPPSSRTYKSDDGLVYCTKDSANRPQCWLNKAGEAGKAPIRAMQAAADRIINVLPTSTELVGREIKGEMPNGDGTTSMQTFPIPTNLTSPIRAASNYDGIVGSSTMSFTIMALGLAGALKKFPNAGISLAFVSPTRPDYFAKFSQEIADYLNDVANNFPALIAAYKERGNVPVQTHLDVETIPFVVPLAAEKRSIAPYIVAGAAMIGLTTIAALSAGKHKPDFLYTAPALGRGRHSRSR